MQSHVAQPSRREILVVTSRANPKIKQVRALRQRKERDATGLFIVEGITHVAAALETGAQVEYVCYAPDLLISPFARELIEHASARGLPCYPATADVFESISEKDNPTGIIAVVHQRHRTLDYLTPDTFDFGVALVSPQDPGNIGSILRTIDAVGASGLILLDGGADVYHPNAVRASMGALFSKQVVSATFGEFARWARQHAYHIIGTSAHASGDYRAAHYLFPLVLLMGSEQKGLSPEQWAICDDTVCMPMQGKVSSLNLAVAAGVMLYEVLAHRRAN
jgi:TrmH family RNA methyltransferase